MEGVNQIKDITVEWEGSGTLTINTDLPGGMGLRRTLTLTATASNKPEQKTFPLDNPTLLEGKLIQYAATPTPGGYLILRRGWIRHRPIGVYLDGAAGDKWETQVIALGG